jgi:hypothetical protein
MTSKKQTSWPVPLRNRDIGLGEAVRDYARGTEASGDEATAFGRVLRRMAGRPRRAPWLAAGFGMGAVAVALATMVVLHRGAVPSSQNQVVSSPALLRTPEPAPAPLPPTPTRTASAAFIRLAASPSVLPAGKVELVDQASAMVSADAVVSGRTQAGHTEIALSKGSIELQVLPRAPGNDFAVSAGDYRFTVVGTVFTVSQTEARLQLLVSEGKVAVWRKSERLTMVSAGGQWAVPLLSVAPARTRALRTHAEPPSTLAFRDPIRPAEPALAPSPLPAARVEKTSAGPAAPPPLAPAPPQPAPLSSQLATAMRRDCGQIAGQNPREAMTCYQNQVAQGGLAGEAAQCEIARLWRDAFHDPARALSAFREQRSRFPRGALAIEADLSIIELLPRLDRHAEALAESQRFLKEHPAAERRGEIHLLRGNIYREVLHDLDHAELEYAQAAETRGRAGDESRFLRAVCLEALARTQEARAAYQAYLSQPKAAHAQEAKKRLDHLSP